MNLPFSDSPQAGYPGIWPPRISRYTSAQHGTAAGRSVWRLISPQIGEKTDRAPAHTVAGSFVTGRRLQWDCFSNQWICSQHWHTNVGTISPARGTMEKNFGFPSSCGTSKVTKPDIWMDCQDWTVGASFWPIEVQLVESPALSLPWSTSKRHWTPATWRQPAQKRAVSNHHLRWQELSCHQLTLGHMPGNHPVLPTKCDQPLVPPHVTPPSNPKCHKWLPYCRVSINPYARMAAPRMFGSYQASKTPDSAIKDKDLNGSTNKLLTVYKIGFLAKKNPTPACCACPTTSWPR